MKRKKIIFVFYRKQFIINMPQMNILNDQNNEIYWLSLVKMVNFK